MQTWLSSRFATKLGWLCFGLSCLAWPLAAAIPFLGLTLNATSKAALSAGVVVTGEVLFLLAGLLLGKQFLNRFKEGWKRVTRWATVANVTSVQWSFNTWFRVVGAPMLGVMIYVVFYLIDPNSITTGSYYTQYGGLSQVCVDIVECMVGAVLLSETSIWLDKGLNRVVPWERSPLPRLLIQTVSLSVLSVAIIQGMVWVIAELEQPDYQYSETDQLSIRQTIAIGSMMALFINAIYTGEFFLRRWQNARLEAERLKRESVEARFEALKTQLDPHFLFNNLNTLVSLVEDNPPAVSFVENLSLVYRYILQNRDKTVVPLADELRLVKAYVFLLQQRFGEALQVEIIIPDELHERQIPPLTLQLLLENAVKHNIVSRANPLHIRLTVDASGQLVVENNRQPKVSANGQARPAEGVGIGLKNIENRYQLLGQVRPTVTETTECFTVHLPLILP